MKSTNKRGGFLNLCRRALLVSMHTRRRALLVSITVGRGPVPRNAFAREAIAGETRSDARMETSEGPRATVTGHLLYKTPLSP